MVTLHLIARTFSLFLLGFWTLLAMGCSGSRSASDAASPPAAEIVAQYGEEILTLQAFEERYAQSVGSVERAAADSIEAYQDFLERYVNFRLKVFEAQRAGYAEDPSLLQEINSYRGSFAKPYLLDKAVVDPVVRLLYERSKRLVDVSHILLRIDPGATPEDTLAVYTKLEALGDSVAQGLDFGALARRHSEDPSARRPSDQPGSGGRIGYFGVGRTVEPFETYAYETPIGEVSPVLRTQFGYHLLYVHDRMDAKPDIRLSHLLIPIANPTPADSAEALARIEDLKGQLDAGENFRDFASRFSAHEQTARNGGDLGYVRYDNPQLPPSFRDAAFALEVDEVSEPVITPLGYHLLTVTERKALGTYEEQYEELKTLATRLQRTQQAEKRLAADIRGAQGTRLDTMALRQVAVGLYADSLRTFLEQGRMPAALQTQPFATLGDSTYTFVRLAAFAQQGTVPNTLDGQDLLLDVADRFLDEAAINYEAAALEDRDDTFRKIMAEFRDGLLLFRLMEDSVWTAASTDSSGLASFFEERRAHYRYPVRTRLLELYSPSDSLLQATLDRLDTGLTFATLYTETAMDSTRALRMDTVLVAGATQSVYDQALALEAGQHTAILSQGRGHVILFNDGEEAARQKTFEEARTELVTTYQEVLEERLIDRLRRTYRARTYPERLHDAYAEPAPSSSQ